MEERFSQSGEPYQDSSSNGRLDLEHQYPFQWLRSLQPHPVADVPHAPTSLLYGASAGRDERGWDEDSATYNRFLLQHHPAYMESEAGYSSQISTSFPTHAGLSNSNQSLNFHNGDTNERNANLNHFASAPASNIPYGPLPPAPQTVVQRGEHANSFLYTNVNAYSHPDDSDAVYMSEDAYGTDTAAEGEIIDSGTSNRKRKRTELSRPGQPRKRRTGQRGGWSKGLIVGPRKVLEPTEEFTSLYNAALEAFVDQQNSLRALELVLQAININPEIFAAHSLLAEIYYSKGESTRAIDVLMTGAHANPNDVETWRKVADMVLNNPDQSHADQISRAMYCFSAILRKDGKDHDARYQRAQCYKELCNYTKALSDLNVIHQEDPHNSSILAAMTEVLVEIGDLSRAKNVYEEHFDFYRETGLSNDNVFEWRDVMEYSELVAKSGDITAATSILKRLSRWLVGRESESFWDQYEEDDREWDQDHEPRRNQAPEFEMNRFSNDLYGDALPLDLRSKLGIYRLQQNFREEAQFHFEWLLPDSLEEDAPVRQFADMFFQVAQALQDAKEHEQSLRYYEAIERVGIDFGVDFWLGMAASSFVCDRREQAIDLYEKAIEADPSSVEARTQLSKLYHHQGDRRKALQYGHEALNLAQEAVTTTERRRYERRDQRLIREGAEKALRNAYQLPTAPGKPKGKIPRELRFRIGRSRKFRKVPLEMLQDTSAKAAKSRPVPKSRTQRRKVSKTNSKMQHFQEVQQLYQTLRNHENGMRDGEEVARNTWMDCAQALVEDFRSQKVFYPGERHKKFEGYKINSGQHLVNLSTASRSSVDGSNNVLPSVESNTPSDYCGVFFSTWLDIMLEYALVLANTSTLTTETQSDCYAAIHAAMECTVFYHDDAAMLQIHLCYLACALALGDGPTLFNTALRWFMKEYAFCTDTYRLFAAINLLYDYPADKEGKAGQMEKAVFRGGKNQKFVFRQIMSIDRLLPPDYNADGIEGPVPEFMRKPRDELRKIDKRAAAEAAEQKIRKANSLIQNQQDNDIDNDDADDIDNQGGTVVKAHSPVEMDIVLFTIYAHIMMAGNSFPNALSYLYRAYSLDPNNCVVLLSMALCYMHQLFKRQNENRHMYVLQGWAWFEKYAEARLAWAKAIQAEEGGDELVNGEVSGELVRVVRREIEFNRARCWEMLGMADLALRGYRKMINLPRPVKTPTLAYPTDQHSDADRLNNDGTTSLQIFEEVEKKPKLVNGVIVNDENLNGSGSSEELAAARTNLLDDEEGLPAEDWTMEAAYAMAIIYAHNGNARKAREITEKYLVVE